MFKTCLSLFALAVLVACSSEPADAPETQVRKTLTLIEEAAEQRSLSGIMAHISDDYADHQGYDSKQIARLAQLQIMRNQKINIFTLIRSIDIENNVASVELSAAMASRDTDLSLESNRLKADAVKFSVLLKREDRDWKVHSVAWKQGW
ncbi:hypothetical protein GCM10008090_28070 [Arenicella chitinivorans]|uniref:Nuclear transport factor 2 family protein n=1 Tax=Arenicella chitinivorans TaxID=1329800 RepID=A0A918VP97_9GAMM|nr:hypothetical protein [Arenicella chitinivorans]GHA16819.1 hypothetical protein GCM10008090_28070 [Arenicella chitinivorans]